MRRTRIKMCGMTRREDVRLAVALGADAVGVVCWPGSARFVSPEAVAGLLADVPPFVHRIGVFVNMPVSQVADVVATAGLTGVQLHGDEDVSSYARLGVPLIKAVGVDEAWDPLGVMSWPSAVLILLDAADRDRRGGTGRTVDWDRGRRAAALRPTVLAGGLTPANVEAAVREVVPFAVDVASGVESRPGVKDPALMQAFVEAVRRADDRSSG